MGVGETGQIIGETGVGEMGVNQCNQFKNSSFDGVYFSTVTDICSNNGCQHGICVPDGLAVYHCSCDAGYTGDMCQTSEYSLITIIHLCNIL